MTKFYPVGIGHPDILKRLLQSQPEFLTSYSEGTVHFKQLFPQSLRVVLVGGPTRDRL